MRGAYYNYVGANERELFGNDIVEDLNLLYSFKIEFPFIKKKIDEEKDKIFKNRERIPYGDITGYKKVYNGMGWKPENQYILTLRIPKEAEVCCYDAVYKNCTVSKLKHRAEFAEVISVSDLNGNIIPDDELETLTLVSSYDRNFVYKKGEVVYPTRPFVDDGRNACGSGIHFFTSFESAKNY